MMDSPSTLKTKEKILNSTLQIIADNGFRSVTHRNVAKSAGVSLSATNYHFGNIDRMLYEAMAHFVDRAVDRYATAFKSIEGEEQLIEAVMRIISEVPRTTVDTTILYELYAQAARDPRYKSLVQTWQEATMTMLVPHCSREKLIHLAALWEGFIFLRAVVGHPISIEQTRSTIHSVITGKYEEGASNSSRI